MKIGIDIGRSHISSGVVNKKLEIVEMTQKRLMSHEKAKFKTTIENYIVEIYDRYTKKYEDIEDISIGIPGVIRDGVIVRSVNLSIEKPYDLISELSNKIPKRIQILNDTNAGALAELKIGSLKEKQNAIFLTLGTGIGCTVIIDGKILNKQTEFGHTVIVKNGRECKCGKKGCIEKYCSMKSFKDDLRQVLELDQNTHGNELVEILTHNYDENKKEFTNQKIEKVVNEFVDNLTIGLSNLVNMFETTTISIGGSFVYFDNLLIPKLNKEINSNNLIFNKQKVEVKPASLGNESAIVGATLKPLFLD